MDKNQPSNDIETRLSVIIISKYICMYKKI